MDQLRDNCLFVYARLRLSTPIDIEIRTRRRVEEREKEREKERTPRVETTINVIDCFRTYNLVAT